MKNLTWQNPEQLFVAQELINKVKSKCCGIKDNYYPDSDKDLDKIIVRDLYADGLINTESLNVSITWSDCISKKTTRLGDDLIHFFGIEVI